MINGILHEWSFNMKFMKRVWVISVFASLGEQNTEITQTRFINFILNDHSCKILYLCHMLLHKAQT